MLRRPAFGLALILTLGALCVLGGSARADWIATCDVDRRLTFDTPFETISEPGESALDLELDVELGADCSLFDGGACEELGPLSLGPSPALRALPDGRCEGAYGLALMRVRAPRGTRLTASWPDPVPPARALASASDRGSLAPAPASTQPEPASPSPRLLSSTISMPRPGSSGAVVPPPLVHTPLAAGHARGLERPPRA